MICVLFLHQEGACDGGEASKVPDKLREGSERFLESSLVTGNYTYYRKKSSKKKLGSSDCTTEGSPVVRNQPSEKSKKENVSVAVCEATDSEIASMTLKCIAKNKRKRDLSIKATCKQTCGEVTLSSSHSSGKTICGTKKLKFSPLVKGIPFCVKIFNLQMFWIFSPARLLTGPLFR